MSVRSKFATFGLKLSVFTDLSIVLLASCMYVLKKYQFIDLSKQMHDNIVKSKFHTRHLEVRIISEGLMQRFWDDVAYIDLSVYGLFISL